MNPIGLVFLKRERNVEHGTDFELPLGTKTHAAFTNLAPGILSTNTIHSIVQDNGWLDGTEQSKHGGDYCDFFIRSQRCLYLST